MKTIRILLAVIICVCACIGSISLADGSGTIDLLIIHNPADTDDDDAYRLHSYLSVRYNYEDENEDENENWDSEPVDTFMFTKDIAQRVVEGLAPGKYILELIAPEGYMITDVESKNVDVEYDFGDNHYYFYAFTLTDGGDEPSITVSTAAAEYDYSIDVSKSIKTLNGIPVSAEQANSLDLALGDELVFEIEILNSGKFPISIPEILDLHSADLVFSESDPVNTGWGKRSMFGTHYRNYTGLKSDLIHPGDKRSIEIKLTVGSIPDDGIYINIAGVLEINDEHGNSVDFEGSGDIFLIGDIDFDMTDLSKSMPKGAKNYDSIVIEAEQQAVSSFASYSVFDWMRCITSSWYR